MTELELAERYVSSTGMSVFLTGKACTGKTTFLHRIVQTTVKRCVVLAPTGVAAVNAGGVTLHSFFQLPLCSYLPDVKELVTEYQMPNRFKSLSKEKIKIIRTLDLLIIDEISMVRADLLDAVDMTLRRYRRSAKPFGGVQLLMIGDVQQLPPVVTDSEKPYMDQVYPSPFFFHSKALQRTHYVTIELQTVFRQQDSRFVDLLNNVRENRLDATTLQLLNGRYDSKFNPPDSEAYIRLTTHNYQADEVNRRKLEQLQSTPIVLEAEVEGNFPETSFPTGKRLVLKKGAQVMFLKNDGMQGAYYNGKIATVEGFDPDQGVAVVDRDGNHIVVGRERWENIKYEINPADNQIRQVVDGSFVQYPLRLAWAVTIHKSQGLTFDRVIVDAASAFASGQVYVALSRCRSLEGLVLATPITASCIMDDADVAQFNRTFPSRSQVEEGLSGLQVEYFYDLLFELFDFSLIYHAGDKLNSVYQRSLRKVYPEHSLTLNTIVNDKLVTLSQVSEKFRKQLTNIRLQTGSDIGNAQLRERIGKGASYFYGQVSELVTMLRPILEVKVDKKSVAADFKTLSSDFFSSLQLKQYCLLCVRDNGFTAQVYNNAKVEFLLGKKDDVKQRRSAKRKSPSPQTSSSRHQTSDRNANYVDLSSQMTAPSVPAPQRDNVAASASSAVPVQEHTETTQSIEAEPKKPKTPAWVEAAQQYSEGQTIADIAASRGIAVSTAESYIYKAYESGIITIDLLLDSEQFDEIVEYIIENRPQGLKEMYDHFEGRYKYYQLRAAWLASKDIVEE